MKNGSSRSLHYVTAWATMDVLAYEKKVFHEGFHCIAGVDEAGRGPLAGPVVAAAVILPIGMILPGVSDSKKLSPIKRLSLFQEIYTHAISIGVGVISAAWIDQFNIRNASLFAMQLAVLNLAPRPNYLLLDGNVAIPSFFLPQLPIVKGDSKSHSISAASIIAKVSRDFLMDAHHESFEVFDFATHKGYPTQVHRNRICEVGPCFLHRSTFKGVREFLQNKPEHENANLNSSTVRSAGRAPSSKNSAKKRISDPGDQLPLPVWRD